MLKSYLRIETGANVYPEDLKSSDKFLKGHKDHFAIMNLHGCYVLSNINS